MNDIQLSREEKNITYTCIYIYILYNIIQEKNATLRNELHQCEVCSLYEGQEVVVDVVGVSQSERSVGVSYENSK